MKLNKKEREFYKNIPNCVKFYYREDGVTKVDYWNITDGICDDFFDYIDHLKRTAEHQFNLLRTIYFVKP